MENEADTEPRDGAAPQLLLTLLYYCINSCWKCKTLWIFQILKGIYSYVVKSHFSWEFPFLTDHLTCLLRNLYAGQEATIRTRHGTTNWFQIGKGVHQGCILSLCLFNLYAECIMWNAGLDEAQAGIKIAGRNINNLRYAILMAESKKELKSLLMKVKESEKADLKLSIQKPKIMASSPTTLWQVDGETMETMTEFVFLGSKITADGDCSHEIKRHMLLGRKAMTKLDNILKSRDITLPTKVRLIKAVVFPVVMYGCESWIINKAEHWRTDAFELWCWRKLLRVPWTARRSVLKSWTINKAECWRTDAFELWCWRRLLRVPWTARRSNHIYMNL